MISHTVTSFGDAFYNLPEEIQNIAGKKFTIWKQNHFHPSLRFKCVNSKYNIWSVRITRDYRSLGVISKNEIVWCWM